MNKRGVKNRGVIGKFGRVARIREIDFKAFRFRDLGLSRIGMSSKCGAWLVFFTYVGRVCAERCLGLFILKILLLFTFSDMWRLHC